MTEDLTQSSIPFVLRLGITGHRDPVDPSHVQEVTSSSIRAVMKFIGDIRTNPVTDGDSERVTPMQVRIVSALAEGADRIAVDAAFKAASDAVPRRLRQADVAWTAKLWATIPYNIETYREHDCTSEESRQEFDRLLALDPRPSALHQGKPSDETERDQWYRDIGHHVADRCDVLVALWDGTDNFKPAGTAACVEYALGHGTPVLWIPTARASGSDVRPPPGLLLVEPQLILRRWPNNPATQHGHALEAGDLQIALRRYFRQVRRRSDFVERLRRLEEYNRHASAMAPSSTPPRNVALDGSSETERMSGCDDFEFRVAEWAEPKQVVAEELAVRYQKRFRVLDVGVYALSVVAVTLGAMSLLLNSWVPVAVEALMLVVLLGVTVLDVRRTYHDRWVAYRAVAEYMRSSKYMCFVTPRSSGSSSEQLPTGGGSRARVLIAPWFAPVIEDIWDQRPQLSISERDISWVREMLLTEWVDDQRRWHSSKSRSHNRWSRQYKWALAAIFGLSVAIVAVHTARSIGYHQHHLALSDGILAIIVIGLASTGAAINGLASHANHGGHAERFSDVAYELDQERKVIEAAQTFAQLRQAAISVSQIMLGETTAWFEGMSANEIEIPT